MMNRNTIFTCLPRKAGSYALLAILGLFAVVLCSCKLIPQIKVQNQLEEAVRFWCWESESSYALWSVDIPARSTVVFRVTSPRPTKSDLSPFWIWPEFGLSYRSLESGKEINEAQLLKRFEEPAWLDTHTAAGMEDRSGYEFILTPKEIVAVLVPQKIIRVETSK